MNNLDLDVAFVTAQADQLNRTVHLWQNMTTTLGELTGENPWLQLQTPIRPFMLNMFLAEPLTQEQIDYINEVETPELAQSCVAFQSQVAQVAIQESMEPMRHIPSAFANADIKANFSDIPFPDSAGEWANKPQEFWARKSVVDRLIITGHILSSVGLQLHFLEAFRPLGVQEAMFRRRVQTTRNEHPHWSEEDVLAESKSKTASTPRLASHKGGAAVDMFLADSGGGILDFGHEYPNGGVMVSPTNTYLTYEQWHNRQSLNVAASLAGLVMYMGEDWHFSFGDNVAALSAASNRAHSAVAQFGPVKDFDRENGEITSIYEPGELDELFDHNM